MNTLQAKRAMAGQFAVMLAAGAFALGAAAFERPADGVYADRVDWGIMMDMSGPTAASSTTRNRRWNGSCESG